MPIIVTETEFQKSRGKLHNQYTFRFGKQNLLLTAFATPDVEHEQQWVKFVMSNFVRLIPSRLLFRFIGRSRS